MYGKSGVEGFWRTLENGYRCIEIDIWDGDDEDLNPVVTHGKTLVKDIDLEKVIMFIKNFWLKNNNRNPLVLSLEMNTKKKRFEDRTAEIIVEHLGEYLHELNC